MFARDMCMIRKQVIYIVERLAKNLAGPDCVEDAVGKIIDEDVRGGVLSWPLVIISTAMLSDLSIL